MFKPGPTDAHVCKGAFLTTQTRIFSRNKASSFDTNLQLLSSVLSDASKLHDLNT